MSCSGEPGKSLIFDYSACHDVHNRADQRRAILLIQEKQPMRLLNRLADNLALRGIRRSPFVQDPRRNFDRWKSPISRRGRMNPADQSVQATANISGSSAMIASLPPSILRRSDAVSGRKRSAKYCAVTSLAS
jgi:hypothetical protein